MAEQKKEDSQEKEKEWCNATCTMEDLIGTHLVECESFSQQHWKFTLSCVFKADGTFAFVSPVGQGKLVHTYNRWNVDEVTFLDEQKLSMVVHASKMPTDQDNARATLPDGSTAVISLTNIQTKTADANGNKEMTCSYEWQFYRPTMRCDNVVRLEKDQKPAKVMVRFHLQTNAYGIVPDYSGTYTFEDVAGTRTLDVQLDTVLNKMADHALYPDGYIRKDKQGRLWYIPSQWNSGNEHKFSNKSLRLYYEREPQFAISFPITRQND